MVFQVQLTKQQEILPLTRDYMFDAERELRASDHHGSTARKQRTKR